MSLRQRIPDPRVLIELQPEELASQLLAVIPGRTYNGIFNRNEVSRLANEYQQQQGEIEVAITEAWGWLEIGLFILKAPGANGNNGWYVLGRRGRQALQNPQLLSAYRRAAAFPRELLHPAIAEHVWTAMARGDYDVAVLYAFRTVEEAVRRAGGFGDEDYGV